MSKSKYISFRIDKRTKAKLYKLHRATNLSVSHIVRQSLIELLDKSTEEQKRTLMGGSPKFA